MSSPATDPCSDADADADPDPRPLPPREPALEDCCGSGCVHCVFDLYEAALANHARALRAWQERHPDPTKP
jgi:hypothetical protein